MTEQGQASGRTDFSSSSHRVDNRFHLRPSPTCLPSHGSRTWQNEVFFQRSKKVIGEFHDAADRVLRSATEIRSWCITDRETTFTCSGLLLVQVSSVAQRPSKVHCLVSRRSMFGRLCIGRCPIRAVCEKMCAPCQPGWVPFPMSDPGQGVNRCTQLDSLKAVPP